MNEDRKRFDRCLTPMGTVPISVIYGYNNYCSEKCHFHQLKTRFQYPGEQKSVTPQSNLSAPKRGTGVVTSPSWPLSLAAARSTRYPYVTLYCKL